MGLVPPETFDDQAISLVYVAGRPSEGRQVEQTLSTRGIDYAVDVEPFERLVLGLFPQRYQGIGFYVRRTDADAARHLLREACLRTGLVEEEPQA